MDVNGMFNGDLKMPNVGYGTWTNLRKNPSLRLDGREGFLLFADARHFRHPSHRPTAWLSPYASRFTTNHNYIWERNTTQNKDFLFKYQANRGVNC